jgi:hypothetical protein
MSAAANPAPPPPTITTEVGRAFAFGEELKEKFGEDFEETTAAFATG